LNINVELLDTDDLRTNRPSYTNTICGFLTSYVHYRWYVSM